MVAYILPFYPQGGVSQQKSASQLKQVVDGLKKQLEEERSKHHLHMQVLFSMKRFYR